MELISSRPRQESFIPISQKSWAVNIRQRYGELPQLAARFTPATQRYCALNMEKAVEHEPSFDGMLHAYGEDGIASLLATHITDAIMTMGEERDIDDADIQFTARAICDLERFRNLHFATILGFFYWLKCGEFDIYGKLTPSKILMTLRKYSEKALAREQRILREKECREAREERERAKAEAVDLSQVARRQGRADGDFAALINEAGEKAAAERKCWNMFCNFIFVFPYVIAYVVKKFLQVQKEMSERKDPCSDKERTPK